MKEKEEGKKDFNTKFFRFLKEQNAYQDFFNALEKTIKNCRYVNHTNDYKEYAREVLISSEKSCSSIEAYNPFSYITYEEMMPPCKLSDIKYKWQIERVKIGFKPYEYFIKKAIENDMLFTSSLVNVVFKFKELCYQPDWKQYYIYCDMVTEKLTPYHHKVIYLGSGAVSTIYKNIRVKDFIKSLKPITEEEALNIIENITNEEKNKIEKKRNNCIESIFSKEEAK